MTEAKDDGAWFSAKSVGYGSGLPIVWQGWLFLLIHIAVMVGGAVLLRNNQVASTTWVIAFAVLAFPVYAAKTRGGWKWRSGKRKS